MFDNIIPILPDMGVAILQTFTMVGISMGMAILFGIPLGVLLFLTAPGQLAEQQLIFRTLDSVVNVLRSFPFIILLVSLIPLTRMIVGTTIGPVAAAVPLSIAAIPYFSRLVEQSFNEVDKGIIEAAVSMGASHFQIISKVLLSEARSGLVLSATVASISLLSYSAMAGVVGGGGIGDIAIRFGYYRFQTDVMIATILLLIALVQIIQFIGSRSARYLDRK